MKKEEGCKIIWKPIYINNEKTVYEVSEYGNIRNIETGNIIKPVPLKCSGRLRVSIYHNGKRYDMKIHRIVYTAFNGEIPKDLTVDHIDENILNNHYSNLRLLTASENSKIFRKNNPDHCTIYKEEDIHNFFKLCKDDMYYKDAANKMKINERYALSLLHGRRRFHIWEQYQPFSRSIFYKNRFDDKDVEIIKNL